MTRCTRRWAASDVAVLVDPEGRDQPLAALWVRASLARALAALAPLRRRTPAPAARAARRSTRVPDTWGAARRRGHPRGPQPARGPRGEAAALARARSCTWTGAGSQPVLSLRHGVIVAAALGGGFALDEPRLGFAAAMGALQVGFYDTRTPYRARLETMAAATVALALAATIGAASHGTPAVADLVTVIAAFAGGLLAAVGPNATLAGIHSTVLILVFSSVANGNPVTVGLGIVIGGALQSVVSLGGWARNRYGPEERALTRAWGALADLGVQPDERPGPDRAARARGRGFHPGDQLGQGQRRPAPARPAGPGRLAAPGAGGPRPPRRRGCGPAPGRHVATRSPGSPRRCCSRAAPG